MRALISVIIAARHDPAQNICNRQTTRSSLVVGELFVPYINKDFKFGTQVPNNNKQLAKMAIATTAHVSNNAVSGFTKTIIIAATQNDVTQNINNNGHNTNSVVVALTGEGPEQLGRRAPKYLKKHAMPRKGVLVSGCWKTSPSSDSSGASSSSAEAKIDSQRNAELRALTKAARFGQHKSELDKQQDRTTCAARRRRNTVAAIAT